jgi:hypothetical protein
MDLILVWSWFDLDLILVWSWFDLDLILIWSWFDLDFILVWSWFGLVWSWFGLVWSWFDLDLILIWSWFYSVWSWFDLDVILVWSWFDLGCACNLSLLSTRYCRSFFTDPMPLLNDIGALREKLSYYDSNEFLSPCTHILMPNIESNPLVFISLESHENCQ